jgi:hypothetical protein
MFAIAASFRFGLSSMSMIGGHVFASTEVAASRDFSSFMTLCIDRIMTDLETSTIMRTVGRVVMRFCECGGRMTTGTAPM